MVMMGTVVIFFFACLLPFKVFDYDNDGDGDYVDGYDGDDGDNDGCFIFEGVDHVGCDLSV